MSLESNKTSSVGKCKPLTLRTGGCNFVYFGPQMAKNRTEVLTQPPAIVLRTGINNSVAFARWQHAYPTGGHHAGHWHASSFV